MAKIKGPRPLPRAELLPTAIYLPFASQGESMMEHRSRERQMHATRRLDKTDIPKKVQKRQPFDKHMALFHLVEHLLTSHLTSLPLMRQQLQYASSLHPPCMAESHI